MHFVPTPLLGAYLIELDKREDERGFFARFFCEREFGEAGLEARFVQINNSLSRDRGTLRGMSPMTSSGARQQKQDKARRAIGHAGPGSGRMPQGRGFTSKARGSANMRPRTSRRTRPWRSSSLALSATA